MYSATQSNKPKSAGSFFRAIIFFVLTATLPSAAATVPLAWSPNTGPAVAGFRIYYGPASHTYTNSIAVGNVTATTIRGLVEGATYFFAATTYDNAGRESAFSDEVTYYIPGLSAPPPVVTNTPPDVTVTPPVDTGTSASPTLNPIADLTLRPNTALRSVVLTGLSAGSDNNGAVTVTATSSSELISTPTFHMSGSGTAGTLLFRTAPNVAGSAVITVTVSNDGAENNTFTRSFTVTLLSAAPVANLRPPTFFRKPGNVTGYAGRSVSIKAAAAGPGPLKYAWKFNGRPIAGATSSTLTLNKISSAQAGVYSVKVSSPFGSTNSLAALTVLETPAATLGTMTRNGNGNYTFPVTGISGYKYVVQATTDLTHWTSVATNTSPFVFEDTQSADNEKRFFRAYYDPAL